MTHVVFIETGMASELVPMSDGRAVDAAPVGVEGIIGLPQLLANSTDHHHSLMQIPGSGLRVPAEDACGTFESSTEFRHLILRYIHARFLQATQGAACNLLHSIEERVARWLLVAQYHARTEKFCITQEFLAEMLGANRSTITLTLAKLERSGLVTLRRGVVQITEVDKLSAMACECNQLIAQAFNRIYR